LKPVFADDFHPENPDIAVFDPDDEACVPFTVSPSGYACYPQHEP